MEVGEFLAKDVIAIWVRGSAVLPSTALIWLLFLWNAVVFIQQTFGFLLAGLSEVKRLTFYAVVSTLASGSLMYLFVQRFGQEGVVGGMLLGYLPFLLLGNLAEVIRVLKDLPHDDGDCSALIHSQ